MDFISLGPRPLKKINIDQYYLGKDITMPDIFIDKGDLSVNDLIIDGKSISEIIQDVVEEQTKIISKNTSISDYTTSIELPIGQSSITFSFQDIGYHSVNENIPQIISALRIPDESNTLYQYSINQISTSGFTIVLSDEIQEVETFMDLRISQALNPDQVSEISKVSSGVIQLNPETMTNKDQYVISFNQQYPANQKISVICSLESTMEDPIITCQAINVTNSNATIQFSDDIPNSNYKLLYIGYPVSD